MWSVKLVFGNKFTAKKMKEYGSSGVMFSGTEYTKSGLVFTNKNHIAKIERIAK